jgi:uncharacterized protein (DUF362 family)
MKQVEVVVSDASPPASLAETFGSILTRSPDLLPDRLPPKVVIKPNLCDNASWETGVTTDPAWLGVLAQELRARRPDVRIQVVEADAISAYRAFRCCDESFDRLGYREAASEFGVELVNLSKTETWEVQVPTFPTPLPIPALFFDDFFFISVANVKLHPYERFTGVLKNNYGLLPECDRTNFHMRLPEILFTLHQLCSTDLAILDGRIGLEGKGPIIGRPRRLNRLIVGNDAVAADQAACRIIGIEPSTVPHLCYAAARAEESSKSASISGNLSVVPFVVDDPDTASLIIRKFGVRRFYAGLERNSQRIISWIFEARRNPWAFLRRVVRRLLRTER